MNKKELIEAKLTEAVKLKEEEMVNPTPLYQNREARRAAKREQRKKGNIKSTRR